MEASARTNDFVAAKCASACTLREYPATSQRKLRAPGVDLSCVGLLQPLESHALVPAFGVLRSHHGSTSALGEDFAPEVLWWRNCTKIGLVSGAGQLSTPGWPQGGKKNRDRPKEQTSSRRADF